MDFVEYQGSRVPATYLGDAVYALYDGDGYLLRVNDHRNEVGQIYLEWPVVDCLFTFIENCKQLGKTSERKESENLASFNNTQEG